MIPATREHLEIHENSWKPMLRNLKAQDAEWEWLSDFLNQELPAANRETYALVAADVLHGLMSIELQEGRIYVERLAVAPVDRDPRTKTKGVGAALVLHAINRSAQRGHGGRLWLHSLEDKDTIAFYENKLKMVETARDRVDGEDLRRFELSPERAKELLGGTS